ncbi:hypothetical protein BSF40_51070 [Pseudomonas sp. ACN5]|nr:hypothetical protein BSF40_51070 [Pseudomonas sp. ACN5]
MSASPWIHCGSGLARESVGTSSIDVTDNPLSRASPLPQVLCRSHMPVSPQIHCGSGLARESVGTSSIDVTDNPLSRASSLPQVLCQSQMPVGPQLHCGSGLARESVGSSSIDVTDKPLSRASPLPQVCVNHTCQPAHRFCARQSSRLFQPCQPLFQRRNPRFQFFDPFY